MDAALAKVTNLSLVLVALAMEVPTSTKPAARAVGTVSKQMMTVIWCRVAAALGMALFLGGLIAGTVVVRERSERLAGDAAVMGL